MDCDIFDGKPVNCLSNYTGSGIIKWQSKYKECDILKGAVKGCILYNGNAIVNSGE